VVIIAGTVASAVILVVLIGVLCVLTLYICRVRRLQGVSAGQLICAFVHDYLIYQDFPSRNKTWTAVLSRLQMIMQKKNILLDHLQQKIETICMPMLSQSSLTYVCKTTPLILH
jgi:hypothetical protein